MRFWRRNPIRLTREYQCLILVPPCNHAGILISGRMLMAGDTFDLSDRRKKKKKPDSTLEERVFCYELSFQSVLRTTRIHNGHPRLTDVALRSLCCSFGGPRRRLLVISLAPSEAHSRYPIQQGQYPTDPWRYPRCKTLLCQKSKEQMGPVADCKAKNRHSNGETRRTRLGVTFGNVRRI